MAYAAITFGELKAMLAERLGDSGMVFWVADELGVHLTEALRAWGAATGFWRERAIFATTSGQAFYFLQTVAASLMGFTVADRDIIKAVQYSLLEDASSQAAWNGTEMFTLAEVTRALDVDEYLGETGVVLSRTAAQAMPPPPVGRVTLSGDILDVQRVAWVRGDDGTHRTLWREDEWAEAAVDSLYETSPQLPYAYTVTGVKPTELLVAPPPSIPGSLDIVHVSAGPTFAPATQETALGIPDNLSPAIKWGALADLLRGDGQETDPIRTDHAEKRWAEFVELGKMQPTIIHANIAGRAVLPVSLFDFDAALGAWQDTSDVPQDLAVAGHNLVALHPVPDGAYGVTLDVVRNAPIPANDAAFVQVSPDEVTALLDYAEYCAIFKVGGDDLMRGEGLMRSFYAAAAGRNGRIKANARFAEVLGYAARREQDERPRKLEVSGG